MYVQCQCIYVCLHMWAVHLCVHTHVLAWMCWWDVCIWMCRLEIDIECLPQSISNLLYILRQGLSLKTAFTTLASLARELSPGIICHYPLITGITIGKILLDFHLGSGYLNSSSHINTTSAYPTKPPPQLQVATYCEHHHACLMLYLTEK